MQQKIDECFAEKEIPADDSVRLLDKIVEEMDLRALMRAYDSHGRPPATPPRTMLKIVLYAAMEHNYSSRKIRSSCERDMNYIWLLNGAPAPSHFEIARFGSIDGVRTVQKRKPPKTLQPCGFRAVWKTKNNGQNRA